MDVREFQPFGSSHLFALSVTVVVGVLMISLQRSPVMSARWKRAAILVLAVLLAMSVLVDPVLIWWRYSGVDRALASRLVTETGWPFHFCDIASLTCAAALVCKNQRIAELGYLWGVAGTAQGLLTPNLFFEWWKPEYWAFFIQHGGTPVAGVTLAFGMGLAPQPGAVRRAILWGILYLLVAGLANWLLEACFTGVYPNYGFVCAKPTAGSLLDFLGPWPWYLLALVVVAIVLFNLLCLLWSIRDHHNRPGS